MNRRIVVDQLYATPQRRRFAFEKSDARISQREGEGHAEFDKAGPPLHPVVCRLLGVLINRGTA